MGERAPPSVKRSKIFVIAGEVSIARAPEHLVTVLGSCVAVCLWSAEMKLGGINHFLFPSSSGARDARGGDFATAQLFEKMEAAGAIRARLVAKVFGGASLGRFQWHVGPENILSAWDAIARARVPIVATDVGGERGRHLTFDVTTGLVHVRYLARPPSTSR